jgi:hypothetical protein
MLPGVMRGSSLVGHDHGRRCPDGLLPGRLPAETPASSKAAARRAASTSGRDDDDDDEPADDQRTATSTSTSTSPSTSTSSSDSGDTPGQRARPRRCRGYPSRAWRFRIDTFKIIDPHLYYKLLGCPDVSSFVNGAVQKSIDDRDSNVILVGQGDYAPGTRRFQEFPAVSRRQLPGRRGLLPAARETCCR